jgi:hypothetical protein
LALPRCCAIGQQVWPTAGVASFNLFKWRFHLCLLSVSSRAALFGGAMIPAFALSVLAFTPPMPAAPVAQWRVFVGSLLIAAWLFRCAACPVATVPRVSC